MKSLDSIRNKLVSLALASILGAVPALAHTPSGIGGGRWVQSSPRTTFLRGFLSNEQGQKQYLMEAALVGTDNGSGPLYGQLHPLVVAESPTPIDNTCVLYGDYKRRGDGSGTFEAVVMAQVWAKGMPLLFAIGRVDGAMSRAIEEPIDLAPAIANVKLDVKRVTKPVADYDSSQALIARIPQTRLPGLIRARVAELARSVDVKAAFIARRSEKGTFRAHWLLN